MGGFGSERNDGGWREFRGKSEFSERAEASDLAMVGKREGSGMAEMGKGGRNKGVGTPGARDVEGRGFVSEDGMRDRGKAGRGRADQQWRRGEEEGQRRGDNGGEVGVVEAQCLA